MRRLNRITLGGFFGALALAVMLIGGSSAFPNMAIGKSSSHHINKSSSNIPLITNSGISGSRLTGFHNQTSISSHLYSAPPVRLHFSW